MKFQCVLFLLLFSLIVFLPSARAGEDVKFRKAAQSYVRKGNRELAYMQYRQILHQFPKSCFFSEAVWSEAEYLFLFGDVPGSKQAFENFLKNNPTGDASLFALAYLWKIAKEQRDSRAEAEIVQQIIKLQPVRLVFRNSQVRDYTSPLGRPHKAVLQIDKISFYVQGTLFAEIPF